MWFRPERTSELNVSSWLLLFGLGVAWAAVLVPDMVRRNAASRRSDTIGQFARNLSSLDRSAPLGVQRSNLVQFPTRNQPQRFQSSPGEPVVDLRDPACPTVSRPAQPSAPGAPRQRPRRSAVQQRRQDILSSLIAAALLSFLGSVSAGGILVTVHAAIDVCLVLYLSALLVVTRREKVRAQVGVLYQPPTQFTGVVPAMVDQRQRVAR